MSLSRIIFFFSFAKFLAKEGDSMDFSRWGKQQQHYLKLLTLVVLKIKTNKPYYLIIFNEVFWFNGFFRGG